MLGCREFEGASRSRLSPVCVAFAFKGSIKELVIVSVQTQYNMMGSVVEVVYSYFFLACFLDVWHEEVYYREKHKYENI